MTTDLFFALDVMLASALVILAVAALHSRNLRRSVIAFIVFGLVVALAWARLRAPDVALAEAAIGAGVAGALLLAALRDRPDSGDTAQARGRPPWQVLTTTYVVVGLGLLVSWAFVDATANHAGPRLGGMVEAELANSGVSNPVTAVLLNFRAYDTLLEVAVLFAAMLGVLVLGRERPAPGLGGPIEVHLVAWLAPLMIVSAAYLLWVGAHAPGGAFQAGALLAGAGIIVRLTGNPKVGLPSGVWLRMITVAGTGVFMLVGLMSMFGGNTLLQYPMDWAGTLILLIEVFAMLSIAAALLLVYFGGQPTTWQSDKERRRA